MKFKVTATIPIELEIDCQSKEEALDTATTILQEQRDDGDYASIVADCIESALVSGSITMTAVDNHEALVNELRTKRKISIQDMDAFLGYEIDKNDDMIKVTKKEVLEVFVALNQNGRPIEEAVLNHAKKLLDDIR